VASTKRRQTKRDRAVRTYVRRELHAHTEAGRAQLGGSHFDARTLKSTADLASVPHVDLADAGNGARHLVQPTSHQLLRSGSPWMRVRTLWAMTWGSWSRFLHLIEPSYRPVHYFTADGVSIGAAAKDLVRLAALGADWMRRLGVHGDDSVALLEGAKSAIEPWELSGGTRRAGVPLAVVEHPADAHQPRFTVIAGRPEAVLEALQAGAWPELRLVLVFGRDAERVSSRVAKLDGSGRIAVRRAWAVPGTRSVWFECAGGPDLGWHTTAEAEHVELGDDDEVVWTGVGWAGTVFLRLRSGVRAAALDASTCPACGHHGPRLFLIDGSPALARFLRDDPRVAEFRLTAAGADVLPVRSGANARLVSDAKAAFPKLAVTVKAKRGWQQ
jgi:hypothetical protein